mgnify:CR=1 FL=1
MRSKEEILAIVNKFESLTAVIEDRAERLFEIKGQHCRGAKFRDLDDKGASVNIMLDGCSCCSPDYDDIKVPMELICLSREDFSSYIKDKQMELEEKKVKKEANKKKKEEADKRKKEKANEKRELSQYKRLKAKYEGDKQ